MKVQLVKPVKHDLSSRSSVKIIVFAPVSAIQKPKHPVKFYRILLVVEFYRIPVSVTSLVQRDGKYLSTSIQFFSGGEELQHLAFTDIFKQSSKSLSFHFIFHRAFEKGMFSDISFVIQGETIPAHRVVLAARSSYFAERFMGKWKNKTTLFPNVRQVSGFKLSFGLQLGLQLHEPCQPG